MLPAALATETKTHVIGKRYFLLSVPGSHRGSEQGTEMPLWSRGRQGGGPHPCGDSALQAHESVPDASPFWTQVGFQAGSTARLAAPLPCHASSAHQFWSLRGFLCTSRPPAPRGSMQAASGSLFDQMNPLQELYIVQKPLPATQEFRCTCLLL